MQDKHCENVAKEHASRNQCDPAKNKKPPRAHGRESFGGPGYCG
jgi:hypothetical protein